MTRLRYLFWKLPTAAADLEKLADELGVSMFDTAVTKYGKTGTNTYEVQRRIRDAIKDWRGSWLWLLAFISAVASALSALAAWMAVLTRSPK